jgi:hypothetical protein
MKIDEELSKVFDIEPMKNSELIDVDGSVIAPTDEKVENDYNAIRNNLYSILNQGQEALLHALEVAKQSEHPRAFEVVGNLMKNLSDINHQIIDLHTKRTVLESKSTKTKDEVVKNVTNNSIFVGSTTELSKMIEQMKKGE